MTSGSTSVTMTQHISHTGRNTSFSWQYLTLSIYYKNVDASIQALLILFSTCFWYSHDSGKFKHIFTGFFFRKVAYTRYNVPWLVEQVGCTFSVMKHVNNCHLLGRGVVLARWNYIDVSKELLPPCSRSEDTATFLTYCYVFNLESLMHKLSFVCNWFRWSSVKIQYGFNTGLQLN
jgi:hypothetical protein